MTAWAYSAPLGRQTDTRLICLIYSDEQHRVASVRACVNIRSAEMHGAKEKRWWFTETHRSAIDGRAVPVISVGGSPFLIET